MSSDVKWIKLSTQMFEDEKIRLIESMPEADTILIIWVKLLSQAGKTNASGYIYLAENIPYTDEMLATIFNRPLPTVRLALSTLKQFGMIEISEDQMICISNWEKHQNVAGLDKIREQTRQRVARHREQKRLEMDSQQCQYCGNDATGYDHILATARGGLDVDANKVECCVECNRMKNDKPVVNFLNANRNRIKDELVTTNPKLKQFVALCNVTGRYIVTDGNATELEEELDKEKNKYSAEFESFWSIYPNKKDKKGAYEKFKQAVKRHSVAIIMKGATDYARECEIKETEKRYIKHPKTFLHNDSFLDEFETTKVNIGTHNKQNRYQPKAAVIQAEGIEQEEYHDDWDNFTESTTTGK